MSDSFMSPGSVEIKKCLSGRNVLSLDVHRKSRISKTWASLVVQLVKNLPATQIRDTVSIPRLRRPLEEEMATNSSILAWKIPWTEEPRGLQSKMSQETQLSD